MIELQQPRAARSLDEFAEIVSSVAQEARVDAIVCVTESGRLYERIREDCPAAHLIAATPSDETHMRLLAAGGESIHIPIRVASRFKQAQHALAVAIDSERLQPGDFVVVAIGQGLPGYGGDFLVLMDIQPEAAKVSLHELIPVPKSVERDTLAAALDVACRIGRAAKRGKRIGALFIIGDSRNVLKSGCQLVFNPFRGYSCAKRDLTQSEIHEMLVELAKLDGAFVVRGDGYIEAGGIYLAHGGVSVDVPQGLGARHMAAATTTARTNAVAVVVSATDGNVRIFCEGKLVLRIDPEGPLPEDR
jgi:DNA integrity scanning protein DisA with diadenylate cyclase activity